MHVWGNILVCSDSLVPAWYYVIPLSTAWKCVHAFSVLLSQLDASYNRYMYVWCIYIYICIYKHEVFSAYLLQKQIFSDQHFYGTVMKTLWYTGVAGSLIENYWSIKWVRLQNRMCIYRQQKIIGLLKNSSVRGANYGFSKYAHTHTHILSKI